MNPPSDLPLFWFLLLPQPRPLPPPPPSPSPSSLPLPWCYWQVFQSVRCLHKWMSEARAVLRVPWVANVAQVSRGAHALVSMNRLPCTGVLDITKCPFCSHVAFVFYFKKAEVTTSRNRISHGALQLLCQRNRFDCESLINTRRHILTVSHHSEHLALPSNDTEKKCWVYLVFSWVLQSTSLEDCALSFYVVFPLNESCCVLGGIHDD